MEAWMNEREINLIQKHLNPNVIFLEWESGGKK